MSSSSPRVIPLDLYSAARTRYLKFVEAVKPIVGKEGDEEFGKHTLLPSHLFDMVQSKADFLSQVITGLQAQIENPQTQNTKPWIDVEQFGRDLNKIVDLCNSTSTELKTMMEARGFTVAEFYDEYNRRWKAEEERTKGKREWPCYASGSPQCIVSLTNADPLKTSQ